MSVGQLLDEYFRNRQLGPAAMEGRAVELWAEVVGEYVARVLYVSFSSAAVRAEIFMRRRLLMDQLNARLRGRVVRNIVVR